MNQVVSVRLQVLMVACLSLAIVFRDITIVSVCMIGWAMASAIVMFNCMRNHRTPKETIASKSRESAIFLSSFAGLGHLYLGRTKIGSFLLLLSVASLLGCAYGFLLTLETAVEDMYRGLVILSYFVLVFLSLSLWSNLSVNGLCDKLNIPGAGGAYEVKSENMKKWIRTLSAVSFTLALTISAAFLYYGLLELIIGIPIISASTILFILSFPYSNRFDPSEEVSPEGKA